MNVTGAVSQLPQIATFAYALCVPGDDYAFLHLELLDILYLYIAACDLGTNQLARSLR